VPTEAEENTPKREKLLPTKQRPEQLVYIKGKIYTHYLKVIKKTKLKYKIYSRLLYTI
jgi:hypothetical protein